MLFEAPIAAAGLPFRALRPAGREAQSKLVDRLVRAGLLERTFCETDRRVSYATLMPGGSELLEEMRPVVIAELRVAFSAKLSVGEARTLRDTLDRVRSSACGAV